MINNIILKQYWPASKYLARRFRQRYKEARPAYSYADWLGICTDELIRCASKYDPNKGKFLTYYWQCVRLKVRHYINGHYREQLETNIDDLDHGYEPDYVDLFVLDDFARYQNNLTRRQWGIIYDRYVYGHTLKECADARDVSYQNVQQQEQIALNKIKSGFDGHLLGP